MIRGPGAAAAHGQPIYDLDMAFADGTHRPLRGAAKSRMTRDLRVNRLPDFIGLACCLCLGFITLGSTAAQAAPVVPVVNGRMVLETDGAHPGSAVKAAVVAEIAPGYHINDHAPSLDYLIPTEVKLDPTKPVSIGRAVYPKGVPRKFEFLDTPISVYQGKLLIGVLVRVDANAAPGVYTLKGALNYQACNEHACLPPASLPLTLAVKVIAPGESFRHVHSDVFTGIKFN
jgi:DsbC/DsbD-like thiol-disulfide interchange protein